MKSRLRALPNQRIHRNNVFRLIGAAVRFCSACLRCGGRHLLRMPFLSWDGNAFMALHGGRAAPFAAPGFIRYNGIAVYAFKTNRTEDVVTFDDEKAEVLKEVYRGLNRMGVHTEHITVKETHLETQENGSVVPVEQEVVKTYLYINTVSLTAEEAANLYCFDTKQREQLGELLSDRNKEMWDALLLQQ